MTSSTRKNYDDILHLPHHQSTKHPRMPLINRAAQFAPFSALKTYDEAIEETSRLTDGKIELSKDEKSMLNGILWTIQENIEKRPEVTIVSFVPDKRKDGGSYQPQTGVVKQIDAQRRVLILAGGQEIQIDKIYSIQFVSGYDEQP